MPHLQQWFDGIYLIRQFNWFQTGCWLLTHQGTAAVLEMPPRGRKEPSPVTAVAEVVAQLSITSVKYLLCTHAHWDHFSRRTYRQLQAAFPTAETHLHRGFRSYLGDGEGISYFGETLRLDLAGEPLYLVYAPKHSLTDTIIIFRGTACTGDWELGTIRSVHDRKWFWAVPREQKLQSIERMERFQAEYDYVIHRVFSVHANDRREGVDFPKLMASTREDRPL
jgi:glyoxylase-like metal-dependent hydrolase (beta-lactamase superfamily II)